MCKRYFCPDWPFLDSLFNPWLWFCYVSIGPFDIHYKISFNGLDFATLVTLKVFDFWMDLDGFWCVFLLFDFWIVWSCYSELSSLCLKFSISRVTLTTYPIPHLQHWMIPINNRKEIVFAKITMIMNSLIAWNSCWIWW